MLPSADTNPTEDMCSNPSSPECEEVTGEPAELIAQGKRNLVCNEISTAVECFQEACRLLAAQFGDFGDEVGDAYLYYGKALLEMARKDTAVLQNVLEEDAQQDDEDDADSGNEETCVTVSGKIESDSPVDDSKNEMPQAEAKVSMVDATPGQCKCSSPSISTCIKESKTIGNKVSMALSEDNEKSIVHVEPGMAQCDDTSVNAVVPSLDVEGANTVSSSAAIHPGRDAENQIDSVTPQCGQDEPVQEGDMEDDNEGEKIPPLQLAWEVLEMAKVIFSRQPDKDSRLKAAESHQLLGEVSLESEMYDQAIEDFNKCLRMQSEVLGSGDRELAATHYQLGMAYIMVQRLTDAVNELRLAKKILQDRASVLEQRLEGPSQSDQKETEEAQDKLRRELDEIVSLLPEIAAKIEDCEEEERSKQKVAELMKESVGTTVIGFESAASSEFSQCSSSSDKPSVVNNISNLVRKKRSVDIETIAVEPKRGKTDETPQNGIHIEANGIHGKAYSIHAEANGTCGEPNGIHSKANSTHDEPAIRDELNSTHGESDSSHDEPNSTHGEPNGAAPTTPWCTRDSLQGIGISDAS